MSDTENNSAVLAITQASGPGTLSQIGDNYTLDLGTFYQGEPVDEVLDVVNAAAAPADTLSGSSSASGDDAFSNTGLGAFGPLPAGGDAQFSIDLDTSSPGAFTETITLAATSSDGSDLPGTTLVVSGVLYGPAQPELSAPTVYAHPGDFGGDVTIAITVSNVAPANGYAENLDASVSGFGPGTVIAASGSAEVAPGASNDTALAATMSDASVGVYSGYVEVALRSNGTGIDSEGTTSLGNVYVPVTLDVNNYAVAAIQQLSGPGTITQNGNTYTLDLGTLKAGSGQIIDTLDVDNAVSGPADFLSGALSASGDAAFGNTGLGAFGPLSAGDDNQFSVALDTTNIGEFTETITLTANGSNPSGYDGALAGETLVVSGDVVPCYCRGTHILTDRGEVAVENLRVGDLLITASGEKKAIKWVGHRSLDLRRHPNPQCVWPICVSAGAFGGNMPSRDLWLSPGHGIATEGVLIQIGALQNGKSVTQRRRSSVEYWHVELDQHDIILAEDVAAESYLDNGNRTDFINGGAFIEAHPEFQPKHWSDTCLPLVLAGPQIARAKAALLEQLEARGQTITSESDLHLRADGERVEPMKLGGNRLAFALPPDRRDIRIMSRTFVPAHTLAQSSDPRTLGVCVKRLQIDGEDVALDDESYFRDGWHELEPGQRWTQGSAPLLANTRLVVIDLAGQGFYWKEERENVVFLCG